MKANKYALLDTDFISKMHFVHKDSDNHLIDRVLELPGYKFFCHQQIAVELERHNQNAPEWLQSRIAEHRIQCFTDEKIIEELEKFRGDLACATYTQMLKSGCEAFSKGYFTLHYKKLDEMEALPPARNKYLELLKKLDNDVGKHNSLGEIKSYVLLQFLSLMMDNQIYLFCSDDKNARKGILNFEDVQCISVLTAFVRLKNEMKWGLNDAKPYIQSLTAFCRNHNQFTFRVMEASSDARMCKVPCTQVLEEIFMDCYVELKNGFLKYKY